MKFTEIVLELYALNQKRAKILAETIFQYWGSLDEIDRNIQKVSLQRRREIEICRLKLLRILRVETRKAFLNTLDQNGGAVMPTAQIKILQYQNFK